MDQELRELERRYRASNEIEDFIPWAIAMQRAGLGISDADWMEIPYNLRLMLDLEEANRFVKRGIEFYTMPGRGGYYRQYKAYILIAEVLRVVYAVDTHDESDETGGYEGDTGLFAWCRLENGSVIPVYLNEWDAIPDAPDATTHGFSFARLDYPSPYHLAEYFPAEPPRPLEAISGGPGFGPHAWNLSRILATIPAEVLPDLWQMFPPEYRSIEALQRRKHPYGIRRNPLDEEIRELERAYQSSPDDPEVLEQITKLARRGIPQARQLLITIRQAERIRRREIRQQRLVEEGWGPHSINRNLLNLGYQLYEWSDRNYQNGIWTNLAPDNASDFSYGDLRSVTRETEPSYQHFIMPDYMAGSDYSGSSAERSNYNVFLERFRELRGVKPVYGGHGTYAVAIQLNTFSEDLVEVLNDLRNYPLIDEEAQSSLEIENQNEAWNDYYRSDFVNLLQKTFDLEDIWEENAPEDSVLDEFFDEMREKSNTYWEEETGGGASIDLDRIVKDITLEDLAKLGFTQELLNQWDWEHGLRGEFEVGLRAKYGIERSLPDATLRAIFDTALKQTDELDYRSDVDLILEKVTTKNLRNQGINLEPRQQSLFNLDD